ncbi:MAG TPA: PTS sugar transporter subunit IIA [Candidatus Sulfotelmatobacter sp.]|nr:PTS sugar transporter subunit IIA [Candidatus Sulfotelmatobacter sp.]HWI59901.1 PTS sugar transporter subunit IIA [Bacillota bacterium]
MPLDSTIHVIAPVSLADYTRPALLVPQLRERDTPGIISELSQVLQRDRCVPDVLPFYHGALNQELLSNSALACGIAIPHARLSGVKQLQFAFGRTSQPVIWAAKASWPVQLVFLLAVPATDAASYLHLLACIARLGRQPDKLAQLRAADTPQAIWALLEQIRIREG